jgi:hypothetical protein
VLVNFVKRGKGQAAIVTDMLCYELEEHKDCIAAFKKFTRLAEELNK